MGFEPTQAKRMGSAVNRFNLSATPSNQIYSMINWIETKKNQAKMLHFKDDFFFAQNKKPVKSNHCSINDRLEVCVFEM